MQGGGAEALGQAPCVARRRLPAALRVPMWAPLVLGFRYSASGLTCANVGAFGRPSCRRALPPPRPVFFLSPLLYSLPLCSAPFPPYSTPPPPPFSTLFPPLLVSFRVAAPIPSSQRKADMRGGQARPASASRSGDPPLAEGSDLATVGLRPVFRSPPPRVLSSSSVSGPLHPSMAVAVSFCLRLCFEGLGHVAVSFGLRLCFRASPPAFALASYSCWHASAGCGL